MEQNLFIIAILLINVLSFVLGAKVGQKVVRGETVELPKIEPLKTVQAYNESRERKKQEEYNEILNQNIDNYNGTAYGQQDLPKL